MASAGVSTVQCFTSLSALSASFSNEISSVVLDTFLSIGKVYAMVAARAELEREFCIDTAIP